MIKNTCTRVLFYAVNGVVGCYKKSVLWLQRKVVVSKLPYYKKLHNPESDQVFFKRLGAGNWGEVNLTTRKQDSHEKEGKELLSFSAVKQVKAKDCELARELSVLKALKGTSHVIQLQSVEYKKNARVLVMKDGGVDLTHLLRPEGHVMYDKKKDSAVKKSSKKKVYPPSKKEQRLSEKMASDLFSQVLTGCKGIHEAGYLHHDLKPSNFLVSKPGYVSIADLGAASRIDEGVTFRGANQYAPPEKGLAPHTVAGDVWMIGMSLAEALLGKERVMTYYKGASASELSHEIEQAYARNEDKVPTRKVDEGFGHVDADGNPVLSKEARNALLKMLANDPAERASIEELLSMSFFTSFGEHHYQKFDATT